MKILFANMLEPMIVKGHRNFDSKIINYLSEISELVVVCPQSWYVDLPGIVKVYNISNYSNLSGRRSYYGYTFNIINCVCRLDKLFDFDYILFESFENYLIVYALFKIRNARTRVYIMHHNNVDNIESNIKANMMFKLYCKRVNHITLDEFISNHLIDIYGLNRKIVHYIPHPMCNTLNKNSLTRVFDCVGISNSNEEEWIEEFIKLEEREAWFLNHNKKVVFRSRFNKFDNGFLKVIKEYIKDEDYLYYYSNAKSVFLPFPKNFHYRMSGSLVDSISNYSVVIGTDIPLINWFSYKYPTICKKVKDITDFLRFLEKEEYNVKESEFNDFIYEHSDQSVKNVLNSIFINRG